MFSNVEGLLPLLSFSSSQQKKKESFQSHFISITFYTKIGSHNPVLCLEDSSWVLVVVSGRIGKKTSNLLKASKVILLKTLIWLVYGYMLIVAIRVEIRFFFRCAWLSSIMWYQSMLHFYPIACGGFIFIR